MPAFNLVHRAIHGLFFVAVLVLAFAFLAGPAIAQSGNAQPRAVIDAFVEEAGNIESRIELGTVNSEASNVFRLQLEARRAALLDIAEDAATRLAPLREQQTALGDPPAEGATEPAEIASRRAELDEAITDLEAVQKSADESAARARDLFDRLTAAERERFRAALIERNTSPLSFSELGGALSEFTNYADQISTEFRVRLLAKGAVGSLTENLALPGLLAIVALILGVFVRGWLVNRLEHLAAQTGGTGRRVLIGIGLTLARLILTALALVILIGGARESGLFGPIGQSLLDGLALCAAVVIGAYAFGSAYFSPPAARLRIAELDHDTAARARRWLLYLATIVGLDQLVSAAAGTPPVGKTALSVTNLALLTLGGIMIWNFIRVARIGNRPATGDSAATGEDDEDDTADEADTQATRRLLGNGVRLITSLAAVLAPLLAALGFYAASRFAFYPVIMSCAVIGLCFLLFSVVRTLVNGSPEGPGSESDQATRSTEPARLQLIPVMVGFLLAIAVFPVLALIWGADVADLQTMLGHAIEGFTVGDVKIAPFDFVLFVIVFVIGYMITRVLQGLIRRSVLPYTRLDSGLRSAILAGIGYLGVFLSALIAISATGIDLSNLAIVAGALSVGIGFGLQNIVNNFVSGIILLIERPIKTGDWVEIGGVHGTVQRVNVRSTEIQTFDRSTMFVPNADLISGTVTNWTHGNAHGRLIVPVGAAYGSDARQVESLLLEVARAHPMLLRRPAPYVVFAGFGADSLDFEIRGVLSDVNWILSVASDLRYEIYDKFAEAGIEIPFAQRDVTIKNLGDLKGGQAKDAG